MPAEDLGDTMAARARRRFNRGLKKKPMGLIKKLRKAKQEAKENERPAIVKTHLRDMLIVPEMIGSVIGIVSSQWSGKSVRDRQNANFGDSTMAKSSTRLRLSLRWWATTWESSQSPSKSNGIYIIFHHPRILYPARKRPPPHTRHATDYQQHACQARQARHGWN